MVVCVGFALPGVLLMLLVLTVPHLYDNHANVRQLETTKGMIKMRCQCVH